MTSRSLFSIFILLLICCFASICWGRGPKCQILDKEPRPLYTLAGAYIEESDIQGGSDTGLFEVDASWGCAYWNDTLGGDVDAHLNFRSTFFLQTASLDLPEHVSQVSLDLAWMRRMRNGWTLLIGLAPGLYSDLETLDSDAFFLPVRLAGVKTFSSELSGIAGFEYRSGFDRELFPILGLAWEPDPSFRVELGIPESVLLWRPDEIWNFYGKFTWRNVTYNLRDRENDARETLTLEDYRNTFGVQRVLDDRLAIFVESGKSYHRSLVFERRNASSVELEMSKSVFFRTGIAGYF